ncbi:MAG: GTP 3',8-cyclase 1 [Planctomycetes bacterium]|nr:GTP 3',8-cyclase 1 [Planctomycetota bacterium]MCQ3949960.1 GTP 3',8-cyclase MoaA [Planctomycetota bacterium]GIK53182.1 MAG: GTP 3',8-cyclase MoaA [Planctomycetota bacterium]HRJ77190.1 GTP 3',8-cyclase MoaA [Planctomycetota bacterium]
MKDNFDREIHALRISVTDRCNMRCRYCVSGDLLKLKPAESLLSLAEIESVIRASLSLGFDAFRFTGGEPLVREGIAELMLQVSRLPGVRKLSLSTNASLLERFLPQLAAARVFSLNISLDTLDAVRFAQITRGSELAPSLAGIDAAARDGRFRIKLNTVLMRGFNDDELARLAALTMDRPLHVRFIEYMPFGNWSRGEGLENPTMSVAEALEALRRHYTIEESVEGPGGDGPATYVRIRGARGFVGFISPVHAPFCERCNRLRLTADGQLKGCLLDDERLQLRTWMRSPQYSFEGLVERVALAVRSKPERHHYARDFDMSTVGG